MFKFTMFISPIRLLENINHDNNNFNSPIYLQLNAYLQIDIINNNKINYIIGLYELITNDNNNCKIKQIKNKNYSIIYQPILPTKQIQQQKTIIYLIYEINNYSSSLQTIKEEKDEENKENKENKENQQQQHGKWIFIKWALKIIN